jgi:uncharacterized protein
MGVWLYAYFMTRVITYSLRLDASDSDDYYREVAAFADSWLERTLPQTLDLVTGFREFRLSRGEPDRSDAEYMFELLALGVLIREHGREASRMPAWAEYLLQRLVSVQSRYPRAESIIKALRGLLGWLSRSLPDSGTLAPELASVASADVAHRRHEAAWLADQIPGAERDGDPVGHAIAWLGANDESAKEKRFSEWRVYFIHMGESFAQAVVSRCLDLADEFAKSSMVTLGKYTENVERFLRDEAPKYRHRYDARLISSTRLEYHLGMLGTEILNRAFRTRFLETKRKMVILPPCMCAPKKECKAVETPFGAKCQACTPSCRVNQITKLGGKRGFSVTMIPDNVKVFGSGKRAESIGLVGVSCALTNWNGGWDAGALGIPAQGLLLDYVGCKFHWDKEGIPTDTSLKKLQELFGA